MGKLTIEELKERVWNACPEPPLCGPRKPGSIFTQVTPSERFPDGVAKRPCPCMALFRQQLSYLRAGVPERFWDFNYEDLIPEFSQANRDNLKIFMAWIGNLPLVFRERPGLLLWSEDHGTAKSALASIAARKAIDAGKRILWVSGPGLFDALRRDEDPEDEDFVPLLDRLNQTDFIVLDELDKIYFPDESRLTWGRLFAFFDRVYNLQAVAVATSNKPLKVLLNTYPSGVLSRISGWDNLEFVGVDFRARTSFVQDVLLKSTGKTAGISELVKLARKTGPLAFVKLWDGHSLTVHLGTQKIPVMLLRRPESGASAPEIPSTVKHVVFHDDIEKILKLGRFLPGELQERGLMHTAQEARKLLKHSKVGKK